MNAHAVMMLNDRSLIAASSLRRPLFARSVERSGPVVDLAAGLVLADAVVLLHVPDQLVALARDAIDVIVGQLAPLLLGLALELAPIAFNAVPVHQKLLALKSGVPPSHAWSKPDAGQPVASA